MKKVIALLLVCFMALGASMALADTRDDSLGLTAGQQTDGLDSLPNFPQNAASFGNVVDFRLGDPNGAHYGDWGGIIHKDFEELGYFGVYYNRPFNQSNGINPNNQWANNTGILNGFWNWSTLIEPSNSSWFGGVYAPNNGSGAYYPNNPYSHNLRMNDEINWQFGWGYNEYNVADPNNSVDLYWAKDFSDAVIGAHINYASQTGNDNSGSGNGTGSYVQGTPSFFNQNTDKYSADSSVIGVDLGATLKNLGSDMSLDLGLGYSLGSINYSEVYTSNYIAVATLTEYYNQVIKDNNISEIRVNALLKNKINDSTTGRIYGSARLDNLGVTNNVKGDDSGDGTYGDANREIYVGTSTYTDTNINFGLACDHTVAEGKAKVIAGVGVIMDSRKWTYTALTNLAPSTTADQVRWGSGSSYTEDHWVVPFNVAIEAPIFGWLTGRIGAQTAFFDGVTAKNIYLRNANLAGTAYTDTATQSNYVNYGQGLNLSYGVSAKSGNFTFDLQLNPGNLLNAAQSFEPGAGILYSSDNNYQGNYNIVSGPAQLFGTIMQADARFAF